jgi:hemolysin-activating ACP:hemolysin acyltransferase
MEILGNAFWLSKKSKLHCKYYNVCGFFSRISQGILLGQYTLIRNDDDIPLAFSVWAKVDDKTFGYFFWCHNSIPFPLPPL